MGPLAYVALSAKHLQDEEGVAVVEVGDPAAGVAEVGDEVRS